MIIKTTLINYNDNENCNDISDDNVNNKNKKKKHDVNNDNDNNTNIDNTTTANGNANSENNYLTSNYHNNVEIKSQCPNFYTCKLECKTISLFSLDYVFIVR